MKTIEAAIRAIEYRLNQLLTLNEQLVEIQNTKSDDVDIMHVYFENEARINELSTLLEYIKTTKVSKNAIKNSP